MSQEMKDIISGLKEQEVKLQAVADKLRGNLEEAQTNLAKVSDAIMVLESSPGKKKSKKKGTGKLKTPAATRADVIEILEQEVASKGVVAVELLRESVEAAVVNAGKNKLGLALRFKEAVNDKRFNETRDGLQLAKAKK